MYILYKPLVSTVWVETYRLKVSEPMGCEFIAQAGHILRLKLPQINYELGPMPEVILKHINIYVTINQLLIL